MGLLRAFDGRHEKDPVVLFCGETHLVTLLDAIEQLIVSHREPHGHRWHVQIGKGAMPQRDLTPETAAERLRSIEIAPVK